VPGIAGMGCAADLALGALDEMAGVRKLRDLVMKGLKGIVPGARLNGPAEERLPNTLNMTLPGIRGESLVLLLAQRGIALSAGSACHAGEPEPSHALKAMGLSDEDAHCSVRISLGRENTAAEVGFFLAALREVVGGGDARIRFVSCR
jgi:cysteine sulfinate desulfinase/cysteine desulfurase-like protein